MIHSFKSRALQALWERNETKGIDPKSLTKIKRILSALNAATTPEDLNLPGLKFHELKGDRRGEYAVTVRANFRIVFEWADGQAMRVREEDYHGK
jgi:proteic killer suppression protein